jgi:hypothetical protein
MEVRNLYNLPFETVYNILINSDYNDVLNYCKTNKTSNSICKDPSFWKDRVKYFSGNNNIDDEEVNRKNYIQLLEDYLTRSIQNITDDDKDFVELLKVSDDYFEVHTSASITLEQALKIAKIPAVISLSFTIEKYADKFSNYLFEILKYINELYYYGPWPVDTAEQIKKYYEQKVKYTNITYLRFNNLTYIMPPNIYPLLFQVFPNLTKLEYFFSEDSNSLDFDISILTYQDLIRLTPNTVELVIYSH